MTEVASTLLRAAHPAPLALSDGGPVRFSATDPTNLAQLLLQAATHAADKSIRFRMPDGADRLLAYADLIREARACLAGLRRLGLRPGDAMILLLGHNHQVVPAFWGCILGGIKPLIMEVPERFEIGQRAFDHVLEIAALLPARLVLTDLAHRQPAAALARACPDHADAIALFEELDGDDCGELDGPRDAAHDTAFYCLTSGSTGHPKCVPISHRNALVRSRGTNLHCDHEAADIYLNWLPFDHIGSLGEHIRCIQLGCSMLYLYKEDILGDPLNLLRTIHRYRVTHSWGPNFLYGLLRDALAECADPPDWDLSCVRFLISGGEPVSAETMDDFLARAGLFGYPRTGCRPSFGMAEVCAGITYGEPTQSRPLGMFWIRNTAFDGGDVQACAPDTPGAKGFADLGRPVPGVALRIVDADGHPLPQNTIGHLQLRGELVLRGYHRDAEFNAQCFSADGWFDSGDLGFLSDGRLALTGRAKSMLIINGSNYYSHEIEAAAQQVAGVESSFTAACAVRGEQDDTDRLALFFHPRDPDPKSLPRLLRQIRRAVVERIHINPDFLIAVDREQIPKTPIGKIQRSLLAERFAAGHYQVAMQSELHAVEGDAPRNRLEGLLVDAWEEVLGRRPGIHDDFFELGGDSIRAVQVMNRFQEKLGAIFHPVSLFDAPTVARLADYFEHNYPALFRSTGQEPTTPAAPLDDALIDHLQGYLRHRLSSPEVAPDLRGGRNRRAVFILSPARSGSTLLRVMLGGNPRLFCPPELYLMGFRHLGERRRAYAGRLAFLREGLTRAVMQLRGLDAAQGEAMLTEMENADLPVKEMFTRLQDWAGERMLVDKTPPYAFDPTILQRLEAEFDQPLYIHLMRHPLGMAASFEEARVDLAVDVHGDEELQQSLGAGQRGEAWWLISHRNILNFLDGVPADRQHLIRFEDLVGQPRDTLEPLCKFLGVDFHEDMLEPRKDGERRMTDGTHALSRLAGDPKFHTHQGISASAAERWKQVYRQDFLAAPTWQIANRYGYQFETDATPADFHVRPDPARRGEPFALTDIQQAYWAGRMGDFELGGYSVHSYTELDNSGLDPARLQRAWQRMVERHEMLRTIILPDGRQQILTEAPRYRIAVQDLRPLEPEDAAAELADTRARMSHQVFALDHWPLFEIRVSRRAADRYRVHLSFDAILFDARSRYILFAEFRRFYEQPQWTPAPFELSFRDYVLAQERIHDSALYRQSREYWIRRLPDLPDSPDLPLAVDPASLRQPRFVQKNHYFPATDWGRLKARASAQRISPSCLLLTVFADVLRAWNRLDRFTINLTAYHRQALHPQVNDIIGDFTSIILLGIEAPGDRDFLARARALQQGLWNDLNHQQFSGVEVLRELSRQRGNRPGARMPVVFTSVLGDEIQESGQHTTDWLGELSYNLAQTPQVWFDHIAFEEGGGLLCRWNVVDGLFPDGLMDAMFDAYRSSLQRLLDDPRAWRADWADASAALLPAAQRSQRTRVNDTAAPESDALLQQLFSRQVERRGTAPALISAARTLEYAELYAVSNRLGHRLRGLGARPNRLVAVVLEKGWQQIAAVLGVLSSGAAYLPLDPTLPAERLRYLLQFGEVELAVTDPALRGLLDWPEGVRTLCLDDAELAAESAQAPTTLQHPTDLAYVLFTSGSTGLPKGVMIDHRGAVNTILDVNQRFGIGPSDRAIGLSSLSFDLSVYDIFGPLAAGGALVLPHPGELRDPTRWLQLVEQHRVSLWNTVPAFAGLLADCAESRAGSDLDSLRLILMSGDWIPIDLPERLSKRLPGARLISLGGATEASIWSILHPIETVEPHWSSIPYGRPMRNQRLHVLDSALQDCPDWVTGELYIGGIGLAQGYWRDEQKTVAAFITHPRSGERLYRTGDLGRYLPDGEIEFLGREDFQIKIQGFRVEIGEIEANLVRHPAVSAAVVQARGEQRGEKQLVAYIAADPGADPGDPDALTSGLRTWLSQRLPGYLVPAVFVVLDQLPLNANGKVDRQALPEPAPLAPARQAPAAAPSSAAGAVALQILQMVREVLERDDIAADDNLFHHGATSIHMMRIVNRMETELDCRPQIDAFYADPRPQALIEACGHGEPLSAADPGDGFSFIADPAQRLAFKRSQAGRRSLSGAVLELPRPAALTAHFEQRRSQRHFCAQAVGRDAFAALLASLGQRGGKGDPKYLYGSAGGLYPVQTYAYVKPSRIADLAGGFYYLDPADHRLIRLCDQSLDERIYNPHINRPVYRRCAFAVFLIADLAAIAPLYPESAHQFCTLEAGLMTQLLEWQAPHNGLGLCQIGELDFSALREPLRLGDSHRLMHSLVGGIAADAPADDAQNRYLWTFGPADDETGREEVEF